MFIIPASSKRCYLNPKGMVYRHPLSSIQHPLEDSGININIYKYIYSIYTCFNCTLYIIHVSGFCQRLLFLSEEMSWLPLDRPNSRLAVPPRGPFLCGKNGIS